MKKTLQHFLKLFVLVQMIFLLPTTVTLAGGTVSVSPKPLFSPPETRDSNPIVIGTGTYTNSNTPIYPYYGYSYSQTIYLQSELNFSNKIITQIGYHYAGPNNGIDFDVEVWLAHTSLTDLTQFAPLSNAIKVYDGPWILQTGEAFSTIEIAPFFYNNSSNLLVTIFEKKPGWDSPSDNFYATPTEAGQNLCVAEWNDGAPYDPQNVSGAGGYPTAYRPNIKLWIDDMPTGPAISVINPKTFDFGDVENGGTKTLPVTLKNGGVDPLVITGFESTNTMFSITDVTFPIQLGMLESKVVQVAFSPTANTLQSGVITFLMDQGIEGDKTIDVTGKGVNLVALTIGEGTETTGVVPMSPYYGYSFSQTLYLQSEINMAEKMIQRIGYSFTGATSNMNVNMEIYLSHTQLTELESTQQLAGHVKVYDGPITFVSDAGFTFVETEGFFYNNTDNLIVTVIEKKPGYTGPADLFYMTPVEGNQILARYARNDQSPYDPTALPAGNATPERANIKLWFGDVPTEPVIDINPTTLDYGQVEMTVEKTLPVLVRNTGGGTLTINGLDFSNDVFYVTGIDFPINLTIGQSFEFPINFTPNAVELEEGTATFLVDESVPGNKQVQLSGLGLRFGVLREGFEGVTFPPLGWKVVDVNADGKGWFRNLTTAPTGKIVPRTGVAAASLDVYAGSPGQTSYDDWLITPEMIWQNGDRFSFWIKRLADQNNQIWRVGYSTGGNDPSDFIIIDEIVDPTLNYTEKSYNLSDFGLIDGETFYMGIQFNGYWSWPGVIDDVTGSVLNRFEKDLMVLDFKSAAEYMYPNTAGNFNVTYANYGLMPLTEGQYQVQICTYINGQETVLATVAGQAIQPGEIANVSIPTEIAQTGVYGIYAKLNWAADMSQTNNISQMVDVEVIPTSVLVKTIGTITPQTSFYYHYPINFNEGRGSSLSQMMYFSNELNTGGIVERLSFYRKIGTTMAQRKLKIWMTTYNGSSLDSYIPPSQQQLVFDGRIDFNEGIGWVNINLDEPFVYAGSGNLVVTVYYYDGSNYTSNALFAYTDPDGGPSRTIYETGWSAINVENPTYIGATYNYPHTTLLFETGSGLGNISGRVLYQADNTAVEGADVLIRNPLFPDAIARLKTDAQGYFTASKALAGENISITISKFGYNDVVFSGQTLLAGGTLNLGNSLLVPRPHIQLTGSVLLSDSQQPASGAVVKLVGIENYQTTTASNGNFNFDNIWGSTDYTIEISLEGYQTYSSTITLPAVAYVLAPITINENAPAPNLVSAAVVGNNAVVSWFAAGQPYPKSFRYDDGVAVGVLITPGNPDIVGGSAWRYDAQVQSVQWFTFNSDNYAPSTKILITILGLLPDGQPNPNDVLFTQGQVTNNLGWNSFSLPTPVQAPNGFFAGISGYNNYTLLAYDDGVGEPWEWTARTQWSNGLGSYNPLENATSPPLRGNIFMRAAGLTTGELPLNAPNASYIVDLGSGVSNQILLDIEPFETGHPEVAISRPDQQPSRAFEHYKVYRKPEAGNDWQLVSETPVSDTSFVDTQFNNLPYGVYNYGVEAVYTNAVVSDRVISNDVEKDMRLNLSIQVNNNTPNAALSQGAVLKLTNQNGNPNNIYTVTVGPNGITNLQQVLKGIYDIKVTQVGFLEYNQTGIDLRIEGVSYSFNVTIIERISDPFDVEAITEGQAIGKAKLVWNQEPYFDNFDSYQPFSITNIGNWKLVDQDGKPTVYPNGTTYPNMGEPMSFMVMNRTQTNPPLSEAYWNAYSGTQSLAAFGSASGATNNWLISDLQSHSLDYTLSFYAKSITETYGLETFRIGYSTSTNAISDFVFITGNETALTYYTRFSYNIPANAKYVAIRHNHTGFALLIDDIRLGVVSDGAIPANGFEVYLNNELVEAGVADDQYQFTNLVPGSYTAGVKAIYHTGESQLIEADFVLPEGTPVTFQVKDADAQWVNDALVTIKFAGEVIFTELTQTGVVALQLYPGNYQYTVEKADYATVSGTLTVAGSPIILPIVLQTNFELTFLVKNQNAQPIANAKVSINGLTGTTNNNGQTQFNLQPGTYAYAVTHPAYNRVLASVTLNQANELTVVMNEIDCEVPLNLSYTQNQNNVALDWDAPVIGADGSWIHWDGAHGNNSVGTGGPVDFDVAQRFVPTDLAPHNGKFLTRVLFVPREAAAVYSVRVWTGGNISGPANLIVDQVVTNPVIGGWNEIFLETPVNINASKELWIGFRSNTTTGHPAGVDSGPKVDGKGNMINLAGGGWQTLTQVAPTLDYNWSVRGLVESIDARFTEVLSPIMEEPRMPFTGELTVFADNAPRNVLAEPRVLLGYNVFRNASQLNTNVVTNTSFNDNNLNQGAYNYHVTSVWSNGCESDPSNNVEVVVEEISCPAPENLQVWLAENNPNLVHMAWNQVEETEFRYDDGVRSGQIGFQSGTTNGIAGAAHLQAATLTEMSWLLSDAPDGGGPHATVKLYVLGLKADGTPNSNALLYSAEVTNTDGQWNTYSFPEAIEAPNGFFLGVAYNGFVGLGTDDGVGAPYIYQNNTHFYASNYTTGTWTTWETSGFSVNAMIRAIGVANAKIAVEVSPSVEAADASFMLTSNQSPVAAGEPAWRNQRANNLLGYNIYHQGVLMESLWQETTYSYTEMQINLHCYKVSAVYDECGESEMSNEVCKDILVGLNENASDNIRVYPIPASETITIEGTSILLIELLDAKGQAIERIADPKASNIEINVRNKKAGVYVLVIHHKEGVTNKKILLK